MRIIAGTARGTPLTMPKGPEIRPTPDRVRGAIFSSLGGQPAGARVLDLFAGTGALGLEAVSRGAASAVLVDSSRYSVEAVKTNAAKARVEARVGIRCYDAFRAVQQFAAGGMQFDLIFADPPYEKSQRPAESRILTLPPERRPPWRPRTQNRHGGRRSDPCPSRGSLQRWQCQDAPPAESLARKLLNCPALVSILTPDGMLVLEHFKGDKVDATAGWLLQRQLRHGDTVVSFFTTGSRTRTSTNDQP